MYQTCRVRRTASNGQSGQIFFFFGFCVSRVQCTSGYHGAKVSIRPVRKWNSSRWRGRTSLRCCKVELSNWASSLFFSGGQPKAGFIANLHWRTRGPGATTMPLRGRGPCSVRQVEIPGRSREPGSAGSIQKPPTDWSMEASKSFIIEMHLLLGRKPPTDAAAAVFDSLFPLRSS